MRDLIIQISSLKSKSQKRIVFRLWKGNIKISKMGILSSVLIDTDLEKDSPYNNFSKEELKKINNFLNNPSCIQFSRNFYSVDCKSFSDIKDVFENGHVFFSERIKKKKHYSGGNFPIDKIQILSSQEFSISRANRILYINYVEEYNSQNYSLPFEIALPKVELYILNDSKLPLCSIKFRYGNTAVEGFSLEDTVLDSDKKYIRNKNEEKKTVSLLTSLGFIRKEKLFQYKGKKSFLLVAEKLLEKGVALFDIKNKSIKSSKSFSCNISYGIDWFDVGMEHDGTEFSSFVYDNINLNSNFVDFNGERYLIPEALQKHKDSIHVKDGKLIIQKEDFCSVLELSSELQKNDIANFENIFKNKPQIVFTERQRKILRPYQIDGVVFLERLKSNGFGALLADDMGLGKTIQTIVFLLQTNRNNCAFVVVPKSLLENWRNEIENFAPNLRILTYHDVNRKKSINFEAYDIVLSTYATTMIDIEFLSKKKFSVVVFDEVQIIKNYKSKMYEAAFRLRADFKMALSGTPFENNILELWAIMRLLNPKIFSKRTFFTKSLAEKKFDIIKKAVAPFMLQRTKKDVLKELPQKIEEILYCTMDETMALAYSALHRKIVDEISGISNSHVFMKNSLALEGLLKLRLFCCHPSLLPRGVLPIVLKSSAKFDVLKIKIQTLIERKEKVVIFSQFTSMLKIIKLWLEEKKIKTFYLDGSVDNRQELVDEFEKSDEGIFLISLKAGGVGLNLVSCHYMFIYDPWWNPAAENQAADRIYRIGQKNNVFIYRMITKSTIEEKVLELKYRKQEIANNLFYNLNANELSIDDFMELLK